MIPQHLKPNLDFQADGAWDTAHFAKIQLDTGITLNYLEQGNPDGEVIILLHGYSDSWHSYALILPLLSKDYHVFALDQRGHGDSSKDATSYTIDNFAADVISFMDAKQIGKATVVGHSMGSLVAQLTAIYHPSRLSRLVLVGSRASWTSPEIVELHDVVQTFTDPVSPDFIADFQMSTIYAPVPPDFLEQVIAESMKVPARVWRQVMASLAQQEVMSHLSKITMPTLILWGDQDGMFPHSEQETLQRLIPNATLLIYAQTGHSLHWEQPQLFVNDLEQFMQAT
jgi:pimeloyl-ACP methyl ester carboxylesterase